MVNETSGAVSCTIVTRFWTPPFSVPVESLRLTEHAKEEILTQMEQGTEQCMELKIFLVTPFLHSLSLCLQYSFPFLHWTNSFSFFKSWVKCCLVRDNFLPKEVTKYWQGLWFWPNLSQAPLSPFPTRPHSWSTTSVCRLAKNPAESVYQISFHPLLHPWHLTKLFLVIIFYQLPHPAHEL